MTIRTNDFFIPLGLTLGLTSEPILEPALGPASGPTLRPTLKSALGKIIAFTPSAVAACIALVVMDSNKPFYYGKAVMVRDFTSFKIYIKEIIWIRGIPFNDITEAWNYILNILDEKS